MIKESQLLAGIYAKAGWVPALAIAASVILGLIATVRLSRWNKGGANWSANAVACLDGSATGDMGCIGSVLPVAGTSMRITTGRGVPVWGLRK